MYLEVILNILLNANAITMFDGDDWQLMISAHMQCAVTRAVLVVGIVGIFLNHLCGARTCAAYLGFSR